jgi:transposase
LEYVKADLEYKGLWKILKSMGYKHKIVNGRKILCEKRYVIVAKIKFLRRYKELKNENLYNFVFLNETWIYQNGSAIRRWVHDRDVKSNSSVVKTKGKRFTILHAGSSAGFFPECDYLLNSKNNDRDYHKSMTGDIFKTWVEDQLLPALSKLKKKSVVIMDNAPYHSMRIDKAPNYSNKKSEMQEWLTLHNVTFDRTMTKKQLVYELIKPFNNHNNRRYVIDDILQRHGHIVLRLPPYHCQYNAIELAWGFCKQYYNKKVASESSSKNKIENLWLESLSKCSPSFWEHYVKHVEDIIDKDWLPLMGNYSVQEIPPIIIRLNESDSEDDDFVSDAELSFDDNNKDECGCSV